MGALVHSISSASIITDSRSRGSDVGSALSVATDSGARTTSPPSKSDSIAEEIQSEKGELISNRGIRCRCGKSTYGLCSHFYKNFTQLFTHLTKSEIII